MNTVTWKGELKYFGDWKQISTEVAKDDRATLINSCGTKAHIRIDDGEWLLVIEQDEEEKITPWIFPEAMDILIRLHLDEIAKQEN